MRKVYIVGPSGSGKTTFARHLSKEFGIPHYELDLLVYDDELGRKRNDEEIKVRMNQILKEDSWIVEDVGREIFTPFLREAECVFYLENVRWVLYFRCFSRWIKQLYGLETANYSPTIQTLMDHIKWIEKDLKNQEKMKRIIKNARVLMKMKK